MSPQVTKKFPQFYPVLPDVSWIERLAPHGIKVVQLRLKDAEPEEIDRQIQASLEITKKYDIQLIVNDYWEAAIRLGADYIHLGQEDLEAADLEVIKANKIKLGVSTHSLEELKIALKAEPDYIALGPVYETILKKMKWAPQGLDNVRLWRTKTDLPLIAIGGLTTERGVQVLEAGADSLAVVTDLVIADDPIAQTRRWVEAFS